MNAADYSALTRRYFECADRAGELSGADVGRGAAGSRAQGTWVQFDVRRGESAQGGRCIAEARFLAFGCPHTIAAAAWLCERAAGLPLQPRLPESLQALRERFAVPVPKTGRLLIVEDAWIAAVGAAAAQPAPGPVAAAGEA
jgi:hypothetical protein